MKTVFHNAKVILNDQVINNGGVEIDGEKIIKVFHGHNFEHGLRTIDCQGMYLSPGFIDIHVHGGGGCDFMDARRDAIDTILNTHLKFGTTSMLPSTLSSSQEHVIEALICIQNAKDNYREGARILGAHLEGNFFSKNQRGAQNPQYIIPPTKANYSKIVECIPDIKMISCAPEVENALDFAKDMRARGIVMSIAHSDATYSDFLNAKEVGFNHVTHIYNGNSWLNSPYFYCQIGVCEAGLLDDDIFVEVIADGKHLPIPLLKLIYKIKGPDRINLCTDAMMATAMPEGNYNLGGMDTIVEDGVAMLADRSSFAGSVCTSNRALRTMYKHVGVPIYNAVKMITATPAKLLGLFEEIGSISIGKKADIVVFDENIDIKITMINGQIVNN